MPRCVVTKIFDLEQDDWSELPNNCDLVHLRLLFGTMRQNLWPGTYRKIFEYVSTNAGAPAHDG